MPKRDILRTALTRRARVDSRIAELERELLTLQEIRTHREWVISGLREHIANIEALRDVAQGRVKGLEEHGANIEDLLERARKRIAGLEDHAANLERRLGRWEKRFAGLMRFTETSHPSLQSLLGAAERIWGKRPDLQARFLEPRKAAFWYWLHWHGPKNYPEIQEHMPPQPDRYLRDRVVGPEASDAEYLRGGLVNWRGIERHLREAGFDPDEGGEVLDFGAGCGRILQFFTLYAGSCRFVGADVDQEAVAWCRNHLDFAHFEHLPLEPPSPFADQRFDAVYAYSVFSHLPEPGQRAWLEDLARITRPGAAIVLTTHGRHAMERLLESEQPGFPASETLRSHLAEFEDRGFVFFPYRGTTFEGRNKAFFESWDMEQYGNTFMLEHYVRKRWTDLFELVAFHEAPDQWQDHVVLRRR
jgi:SAM-dependent methyltransferase